MRVGSKRCFNCDYYDEMDDDELNKTYSVCLKKGKCIFDEIQEDINDKA